MTNTKFYPRSSRGGMGEAFDTQKECQDYCDSISNSEVYWFADEIEVSLAESTRSDFY